MMNPENAVHMRENSWRVVFGAAQLAALFCYSFIHISKDLSDQKQKKAETHGTNASTAVPSHDHVLAAHDALHPARTQRASGELRKTRTRPAISGMRSLLTLNETELANRLTNTN